MLDRNKIREAAEELNLKLSDEAADKCIELCEKYNKGETDLLEEWMSFAFNSLDANPSVEALNMMERKQLIPESSKNVDKSQRYNATPKRSNQFERNGDVSMHEFQFPETDQPAYLKTPDAPKNKGSYGHRVSSPGMPFSPATVSPVTPSMLETGKGYLQRTNSGQVICNYGENIDSLTWTTTLNYSPNVQFNKDFTPMHSRERYMYSTLLDKIQSTRDQAKLICDDISNCNNTPVDSHSEIRDITMENAPFAGRIICDSNGKLNSSSVLLESYTKANNVRLQLTDVKEYSLFPGQCVVVKGKSPDGSKIIVDEIYTDVQLPMYPPFENIYNLKEPLQIVVACGPYMLSNGLYKPFEDLVEYIARHKPHALILIGPILDSNHPEIMSAKFTKDVEGKIIKFKDFFSEKINSLFKPLANCHTKVILVSSWKEACLNIVYPTPPTPIKIINENLFLAPDPSIIDISGFQIGVTSTDILMHLGKEELFCSTIGSGTQRLSRLASHLFQQRSFYPLSPPHEDMSVDPKLLEQYGGIPAKPHLMVVPSDLKSFTNVISDSVFINPEKLTKGIVGGTFARIQVRPAVEDEKWSPATHVSAQVVKL